MQENTNKMSSKKKIAIVTSIILVLALFVGGTFAWTDFKQHKTNLFSKSSVTDVTLNDEFDPETAWKGSDIAEKKVSVTNPEHSQNAVFARLNLKEFLQTYSSVSQPVKDTDGNVVYFATWASGAKIGEYMTATEALSLGLTYASYTVDGVEYAIVDDTTEVNGVFGKTMVDPATKVVTPDELFGPAPKATDNAPEQHGMACDYGSYKWDGKGIESQATAGSFAHDFIEWEKGNTVVTMQTWLDAGSPMGNFWVVDTNDGWAYWANAILPGETTANILESVKLLAMPGTEFEYEIHIDLEAATKDDLDKVTPASTNGDTLIEKWKDVSGGTVWINNGDGTATKTVVKNGVLTSETVIIGVDGIAGTPDDNQIINPAGTVLGNGYAPSVDNGVPFVNLGNGFKLYSGDDGILGTKDDVVKNFGEYAQSDVTGVTKDPLDWKLLDIKNGQAILMTDVPVDSMQFNQDIAIHNWDVSNARKWLNSTAGGTAYRGDTVGFYNTAFNAAEKGKIVTTNVSMQSTTSFWYAAVYAPHDMRLATTTGTNTQDRVWMLSGEEAFQYFGANPANPKVLNYRLEKVTAYCGYNYVALRSSQPFVVGVHKANFRIQTSTIHNPDSAQISAVAPVVTVKLG